MRGFFVLDFSKNICIIPTFTYNLSMIIKPLQENYEVISLRVTNIESSFHKFPREQENVYRAQATKTLWNIWEECINASIIWETQWKFMCSLHLKRMQEMEWLHQSSSSWKEYTDVKFLMYKLENFVPVKIANAYYKDVIATQNSLWRWIECGKYLVRLNGTSDLITMTWDIYDCKYYSSDFWEKSDSTYDIYTLDNYKWSILQTKAQWYYYPWLLNNWSDVCNFEYHLYKKTKNAPSDKNPDKDIEKTTYKCSVDIAKAEHQIKLDIIRYFTICNETGQKPWGVLD